MRPGRAGIGEGRKRVGRIGGIDGRFLEPSLRQAHAAAAHQVDGGIDQHDEERLQEARAGLGAALGVELRAEQIALAHRGGDGAAMLGAWRCLPGRRRRRSCARNRHSRRSRRPLLSSVTSSRLQPICGTVQAGRRIELAHLAGDQAEAGGVLLLARLEQQLHAEADAEQRPGERRSAFRAAQARRSAPSHSRRRRRRAERRARPRRSLPDRRCSVTVAPSRWKATAIEPILP